MIVPLVLSTERILSFQLSLTKHLVDSMTEIKLIVRPTLVQSAHPKLPVTASALILSRYVANKETFQTGREPKTIIMVLSAVGDKEFRLNDFAHPIHLHGHSFHVLYIGHGEYWETD